MHKKRIAIFASGTGSNAINLIHHFSTNEQIEVAFVLSNKADAPVLNSAQSLGIPTFCYTNQQVADGVFLQSLCEKQRIDWVILAGYLRKVPTELIAAYPERMINLHPSLLPKYGGKGMYGANVHKAVLAAKEEQSGITIHFVNEEFDKGRIIAQLYCAVDQADDLQRLTEKIKWLEQSYLPLVIEKTINQ